MSEARERLRELQKSNYAEEEAAVAKERQRNCEQKQGQPCCELDALVCHAAILYVASPVSLIP